MIHFFHMCEFMNDDVFENIFRRAEERSAEGNVSCMGTASPSRAHEFERDRSDADCECSSIDLTYELREFYFHTNRKELPEVSVEDVLTDRRRSRDGPAIYGALRRCLVSICDREVYSVTSTCFDDQFVFLFRS